jgi:type IV pilus assembly protein PilA
MNTVKCPQCNLINWTTQATCKRCGLQLANEAAIPQVAAVNESFSGQQFGANNTSYNAGQNTFQPQNNPFARPTEFNQSNQYSSQNNYRQNNQQQDYQQNYQSNYQPNYDSNPRYQNTGLKIKLAVSSMIFGILGFPVISFVIMAFLAGLLGAIFGVGGGVIGVLIPLSWIPIALISGIVALYRANKSPQEYGGKGFAITGIVLSSLTILLVPIVAAIAIPNLLAARRAANEGSAISTIRTLVNAENTYTSTTGNGNCGDLQSLISSGLIDNSYASGEKSGYRLTVKILGPKSCEISATPTVSKGVTSTGIRSFYSTSDDGWSIHAADKGGMPAGKYDKAIN